MTSALLDANVVIALVGPDHEHHARVERWVPTTSSVWLSPICEGALVRYLTRTGESRLTVNALLQSLHASTRVQFRADSLSYLECDLSTVRGHRQVTHTCLADLALHHGGQLATLDRALAERRPQACVLIPD